MSPYIPKFSRIEFDPAIEELVDMAKGVGELNYIITRICDGYISKYVDANGINYSACNAIVGVLECAKLEFARKRLYPHEDKRCKEEGEVFE